ncbi:aminotransferase class I/II-fold pyridoxal phosphate-dependent enzyme [Trichocoleus sp. FACHB-591]|uniref:aminotransferase class I/II-fold pyridoxal phosphate-dependent enzyme n=1 Tax=Trichocoleus sp. FACHB-591 TaxID=2692872 RepID=UPI001687BCFD|nr:aminotransferase class I/II-fold pyridoxal phosphate-dependent enzyme [Trichocoleus sp. FACHB-591]
MNLVELQHQTPLLDALRHCAQRPNTPFYAPGHKRGQGIPTQLSNLLGSEVFRADLPELVELDNLFAPQGPIQAAQELAAQAFGAEQTWFLANGSTSGVIAAILATCNPGDRIILPRNVHQSAISGLILSGAIPVFVEPEYDPVLDLVHSITLASVAAALTQYPDAKAVLMVYPTYYGVCGDVQAIAQLAHDRNVPLLVDEAHGPHFAFHPELPTAALTAGADLAVQSIHKVLSAMTQAAMLHVQGERVDRDRLTKALQLVQSTSPSYLLLASLDAARQQMATQGQALMTQTLQLADLARTQISQIPGLQVLQLEQASSSGFTTLDRTRLTVTVSGLGLTGFAADEILNEEFGVTAELPSLQHLTFIISLGNTEADIQHLVAALQQLATRSDRNQPQTYPLLRVDSQTKEPTPLLTPYSSLLTPRDAWFAPTETVAIAQAVNRVSAELVCPYPPGIPVLVPGEAIASEAINYLRQVLAAGGFITGCADVSLQTLKVVQEEAGRIRNEKA